MFRIKSIWLNPLLWAVGGSCIAFFGNLLDAHLGRHADVAFTGLCMGVLRWLVGEFHVAPVHASHEAEHKLRNALFLVASHPDSAVRGKAMRDVLAAFEEEPPVRADFKQSVLDRVGEALKHSKDQEPK